MADVTTYLTVDHAEVSDNQDEANNYPQEFLHTLSQSGMPPHTLEPKVGSIVIQLWNLDQTNSLCKDPQLFVQHLYRNSIRAEVYGGSHVGNLMLRQCSYQKYTCPSIFVASSFVSI